MSVFGNPIKIGGSGGGGGGFSPTLIWTNNSPSNSFAGTTIFVDEAVNYNWFLVTYRNFATNDNQYGILHQICIGSTTYNNMLEFESATNNRNGYRKVMINNTNGSITFTGCTYNDSTNNNYAVPLYIYGL